MAILADGCVMRDEIMKRLIEVVTYNIKIAAITK